MSEQSGVEAAEITWDEDGQPISARYGDVYFSRNNGLAETRYVFIQQNQLPDRWQEGWEQATFYIGETGFGSGLNFLAAWQLWEQSTPRPRRLHFISVEKQPLRREDLVKALALWPELSTYSEQLLAAYPELPLEGFHNFSFSAGKVRLSLIVDDASAGLRQLLQSDHPLHRRPFHGGVDAWFLDGFAPAKNPEMWQPELFDSIAALSKAGTTLATFTAAGLVRRELQRVGFAVEKRPGYGFKREMVAARFVDHRKVEHEPSGPGKRSGYTAPWHVTSHNASPTREALVIGAGLAGCHTARALAERGWRVCVLDGASTAARGASGNPQGIVYGKLSVDNDALGQFNLAALRHAQNFYTPFWQRGDMGEQSGVLVLPRNEKERELQEKVAARTGRDGDFLRLISSAEASDLAGIPIQGSALYYPQLGWIKPALLCQALLDHPNITLKTESLVVRLQQDTSRSCWLAEGPQGRLAESATVVVANSYHALAFEQFSQLPLKPIRGQVSCFPGQLIPLKTVVCGEGYIAPATRDAEGTIQSFGATFTLREQSPEVLLADHQENVEGLTTLLPAFPLPDDAGLIQQLSGRTSFRCSTADYLPLAGPAPDYPAMVERYRILGRNAHANINEGGCYLRGLYLNVGHGSRGLAYAALTGELLAAQMDGDLLPVTRDLAVAVNPARFIIRDLIRRRIG